jgi:hypothetical protein
MVEFVVIAPLFFALFLGIIEFGLAFYWWKSAEKAAYLGVRMAVVRDRAISTVPAQNVRTGTGVLGQPCRLVPSPCVDFGRIECTGATCDGAGFDMIVARMQHAFPLIGPQNVRVRYEYVGLGFAGGPAVPAVSVIVTGVDFPLFLLGQIFRLVGGDASAPAVVPDMRATLTGEDLQTGGVG